MKRFFVPVAFAFWAFTWHAYALNALPVLSGPQEEASGAVLKSQSSDLAKVQNKKQFKRRPFITKGDMLVLDVRRFDSSFSPSTHAFPLPNSFVRMTPAPSGLLRSPPVTP